MRSNDSGHGPVSRPKICVGLRCLELPWRVRSSRVLEMVRLVHDQQW